MAQQKETSSKKGAATNHAKSRKTAPSKAMIRRSRIATAVVQGKTEKQIAAELGMTRDGVYNAKAHPETQSLIRQMSQNLNSELERNNRQMVDTIFEGMKAVTVAKRPDHKIRQSAVANQIKLLNTLQPKTDIPVVATISIEELERRARENQ